MAESNTLRIIASYSIQNEAPNRNSGLQGIYEQIFCSTFPFFKIAHIAAKTLSATSFATA